MFLLVIDRNQVYSFDLQILNDLSCTLLDRNGLYFATRMIRSLRLTQNKLVWWWSRGCMTLSGFRTRVNEYWILRTHKWAFEKEKFPEIRDESLTRCFSFIWVCVFMSMWVWYCIYYIIRLMRLPYVIKIYMNYSSEGLSHKT